MQVELTKVEILSKENIRERLFNQAVLDDENELKELIKDLTSLFISYKTDRPFGSGLTEMKNLISFLIEPLEKSGFIKTRQFGNPLSPSFILSSTHTNEYLNLILHASEDPDEAKECPKINVGDILMTTHYDTVKPH